VSLQQANGAPPAGTRLGPSRRTLAGASGGAALLALAAVLALAAHHGTAHPSRTAGRSATSTAAPHRVELASAKPVAEAPDPEEAKSFPVSPSVHHPAAAKPNRVAEEIVAPGAQSNAEVRQELGRMHALESAARAQASAAVATVPGGDSVGGNGQIPIPAGIPEVVQRVIAGANAITDFPYVYGGGHASFVSSSYDCSGSVSYALAAGGLLSAPETSGQLESWGEPGPGKWITLYANAGHVYMYVNVGGRWMRFDTVGRSGPYASRWQPEIRSNAGFVARHPPDL
jgi:cell wall-associated NlpC family hydrolase